MTNNMHQYGHLYLNFLKWFLNFILPLFSANNLKYQDFYNTGIEKTQKT